MFPFLPLHAITDRTIYPTPTNQQTVTHYNQTGFSNANSTEEGSAKRITTMTT